MPTRNPTLPGGSGKRKRATPDVPTALTGIAGVHYVVSELSRRGMIALPTVKNTAAYDIVALNTEGTKHANIQVKASSKKVDFFPMPPVEKIRAGRFDFYVLVRFLSEYSRYEGFLLTGRQARDATQARLDEQQPRVSAGTRKVLFPSISVGSANAKNAKSWARAWTKWNLGGMKMPSEAAPRSQTP